MEQQPSGQGTPQNPAPTGSSTGNTGEEPKVTISQKDLDDLRHKADVSSQNFERAKAAEIKAKELSDALNAGTLETVPSQELQEVKGQLSEVQTKLAETEVKAKYPILGQIWDDFQSFRNAEENKGMRLETAARAFMTEKGLLEPRREGLERTTGGPNSTPKQGMTAEEAKDLREGDGRKYREALLAGKVQIAN